MLHLERTDEHGDTHQQTHWVEVPWEQDAMSFGMLFIKHPTLKLNGFTWRVKQVQAYY